MNETTLTLNIERAISELRRGGKVVIADPNFGTSVLLVAAELIDKETVEKLSNHTLSRPNIILSSNEFNDFFDTQGVVDVLIVTMPK